MNPSSEQPGNSYDTFMKSGPFSVSACPASLKVAASVLAASVHGSHSSPDTLPFRSASGNHISASDSLLRDCCSDPMLLDAFPEGLPKGVVEFVPWVRSFLGLSGSARTSLGSFLRSSLNSSASPSEPCAEPRGDPWPVPPPPRWRRTAYVRTYGPRRRHKCKLQALVRDLVRFLVCCLNWLCLGKPAIAPPCARSRATGSAQQQDVLDVIERHADYFARCGDFTGDSMGRSEEKFRSLLSRALELPQDVSFETAGDVDRLTHELVSALQSGWDGYSRDRGSRQGPDPLHNPRSPASASHLPEESSQDVARAKGQCTVDQGIACKPVIADKIRWSLPPSFDPVPFLTDPVSKALFLEPTCLNLPPEGWPRVQPAKVHCTRDELLKLASKWDAQRALMLFPCEEVDHAAAVGIFAITKDSELDRLIINPGIANSRTIPYSNYTRLLSPGALLTMAHVPDDHVMRMCADDLSEFYYTFRVPRARALRNVVHVRFHASEVRHFTCFDASVHRSQVYLGLSALAMGDIHAVEFAQQSHYNVLHSLAHAMKPTESLAYRVPSPRSSCVELLAIDDHVTAQVCTRAEWKRKADCRDTEIFSAAEVAYRTVGMVQHPRKRRRHETSGTYLALRLTA